MKVNRRNLIFAAIVLLLCLLSLLLLFFPYENGNNKSVYIYVDGSLYDRFDISDIQFSKELMIETQYGFNKVEIKNGMACVSEADCPDKTCVNTGWTDSSSNPVICMPHRLEVIIMDSAEIDGVSG